MSEFYKTHLDAKWRDHLEYNLAWQSRNFRDDHVSFSLGAGLLPFNLPNKFVRYKFHSNFST